MKLRSQTDCCRVSLASPVGGRLAVDSNLMQQLSEPNEGWGHGFPVSLEFLGKSRMDEDRA